MRGARAFVVVAVTSMGFASAGCHPRGTEACGHVCSRDGDDAEMAAAHDRARETVGVLLDALEHPSPSLTYASAQVRVSGPGLGEHIWLKDVRYDGGEISGTLDEDATGLPQYRAGTPIRTSPGAVSDWMTVEGGSMCGGFSLRVDWPRRKAKVRAKFLQTFGLKRLPPGDLICDGRPAPPR